MTVVPENLVVQQSTKQVLIEIADFISPEETERSIVTFATRRLSEQGLNDTWYYSCLVYVLLGSRSCLSVSGRNYAPSDEKIGMKNLVTVDLSPRKGTIWGDCARSFAVEEGKVVEAPADPEFERGLTVEKLLHREISRFVTPDTPFSELYEFANDLISSENFENLDFLGNLGHSIETNRNTRVFIEAENTRRLGEVSCFTFEPHIRQSGGAWGFKHEEIYYFDSSGNITAL